MGKSGTLTIVLLTLFARCAYSDASNQNPTPPFWLTAEVRAVEWRRMCLTAAGCADPRLKLVEWNLISNEKISSSWSIIENNDQQRSFVSHWNQGTPGDVTFGCEISGVDPIYGFPRMCDSTPAVRIFHHEAISDQKSSKATAEVNDESKMIVELTGKCFNASLAIQKHPTHCPWCSASTELSLINQLPDVEPSRDFLSNWIGHDHLLSAGVITLALIAVLSSASFACLLVAYLRRRGSPNFTKKPRGYIPCGASNLRSFPSRKPAKGTASYEQPWDQRNPSSPYWTNANNLGTLPAAPSFNPHPIIVGRSNNATMQPLPSRIPLPPSTSLSYNRQDDSGHESF